jgi:hypothetical protein
MEGWHVVGVSDNPSSEEIAWARGAALNADVVVVFTQNATENAQQQALVAALPPERTLVIALWSPYDALVLPATHGYMVTYSPLLQAHPAICAILRGEAPAQGKFSVALD